MKRILWAVFFITQAITVQATGPDHNRITAALETLRQAVNEHRYPLLEPSLAPGFTYQGHGGEMGRTIMRQVVTGFPDEIRDISIQATNQREDGFEVIIQLETDLHTTTPTLVLNRDYLILEAPIAEIQMAGHGTSPSAVPADSPIDSMAWPDQTIIPFELAGRIIVVQADVNGVAGNYLLDSGAPVIMLNRSYFTGDEIKTRPIDHQMPTGAGGAMSGVEATDKLTLKWGGLEIAGQQGLVADFSHLEKNVGVPIVGLIGYAALEPFQVQFDYQQQELALLRLNEDNQPVAEINNDSPEAVIDIEMAGHVPFIPVTIGGQDLKMGIDSGAEGAMLFTQWQAPLKQHYEFIRRDEMKGGDTHTQMGDVVLVKRMQMNNLNYDNMTFRFNDIGGEAGHTPPFDGLLGYEFLAARPTAINFRSRQLLIWPAGT